MKCTWCGKALEKEMEIHFSNTYDEYFCSGNCADECYLTRADVKPITFDQVPSDDIRWSLSFPAGDLSDVAIRAIRSLNNIPGVQIAIIDKEDADGVRS